MLGNLEPARRDGEKSKLARCASRTAWLFTAGEAIGLALFSIIDVYFHDAHVPGPVVTHATGAAFALVGFLTSILSRRKPLAVYHNRTTQDLAACIADAEMMFAKNLINDQQRVKIINRCIEKFMNS